MKTFREALQKKDFVITAELNLARETDAAAVVAQATVLSTHVDAIQVPDSPDARVQMTPLAVSNLLIQKEIDTIAHLSCRDRNRVALENELLSLGAMGVTSVLLLRGDELPKNHRPKVKQVFELGGLKLIETARALADDPTVASAPDFCIGTVATVFTPKAAWQPTSLLTRVEAGARFIQTQLCFDMAALRRYMTHLVEAQFARLLLVSVTADAALLQYCEDSGGRCGVGRQANGQRSSLAECRGPLVGPVGKTATAGQIRVLRQVAGPIERERPLGGNAGW